MVLQILAIFLVLSANVWGSCEKLNTKRQTKKMINISLSNISFDLDPVKAWNYQHFLVLQAISETLVKTGENGRFVSGIAKTWSISNAGKTITFYLDAKAHFQDGSKIKSIDVAHSLSRHFVRNSKSVVVSYMKDVVALKKKVISENEVIDAIKVIDENTLSINLIGPYAPFLSVLSMPGFSIFKSSERFGDKQEVVGSGAYKVIFDKTLDLLKLERDENYYQELPATKNFCIKQISSLDDIKNEFKNHTLDLAFGVPLKDFRQDNVSKDIKVVKTNTIVTLHAYINPRGDLKSIENRKAVHGLIQIFNFSNHDELHNPMNTFIPEGFLPREYYDRAKPILQNLKLSKPIRLLLHDNYFSSAYIKKMKDFFKINNAQIITEALPSGELYDALDSKEFDVVTIPYMANFPDPDGFLELLAPGQVYETKLKSIVEFSEEIAKIRFVQDIQIRLKKYAEVFKTFENEYLIAPMSKVTLPLMHATGVDLPDTSYKYEADLRKIFWNIKK